MEKVVVHNPAHFETDRRAAGKEAIKTLLFFFGALPAAIITAVWFLL